ncbi:MAG: tRNA (adenosine(37)-N6)-dimethylallyltransferase MiaA [Erythrobacter sp.]
MSKIDTPKKDQGENPLALIAGPTASGKSACAIDLAKAIEASGNKAVVLNADSAQVYADLQILSARPTEEEMAGIEHRLFGTWDGANPCSAAEWAEAAKQEIASLHDQGAVPILVGGTGMYIKVLLEGIAPIPPIDPAIRQSVRALSVEQAFSSLQIEDPERAIMLEPGDSQRIGRALEVVRSTGTTLGDWQAVKIGGIGEDVALSTAILLPDRDWLYKKCDQRFGLMLEHGAIEEVERLLARQLSPNLPVMRAIGVSEISEHLAGNLSLPDTILNASQATRNYAKRQFTWFRRQTPQDWNKIESHNVNLNDIFASLLQI